MAYEPLKNSEAKTIRDDIYWFPKVALYTGMRLNEIAALTVDDFHFFRTTFISRLKFNGCDRYMVKQVVGHMNSDNVTFERYGKNTSTHTDALKELVEEIDY